MYTPIMTHASVAVSSRRRSVLIAELETSSPHGRVGGTVAAAAAAAGWALVLALARWASAETWGEAATSATALSTWLSMGQAEIMVHLARVLRRCGRRRGRVSGRRHPDPDADPDPDPDPDPG